MTHNKTGSGRPRVSVHSSGPHWTLQSGRVEPLIDGGVGGDRLESRDVG